MSRSSSATAPAVLAYLLIVGLFFLLRVVGPVARAVMGKRRC